MRAVLQYGETPVVDLVTSGIGERFLGAQNASTHTLRRGHRASPRVVPTLLRLPRSCGSRLRRILTSMSKKRLAIVGGGVAGVSLAWLASTSASVNRDWDIVLIHDEPALGGHSHSIPVKLGGQRYPIDIGVQFRFPRRLSPRLCDAAPTGDASASPHAGDAGDAAIHGVHSGTQLDYRPRKGRTPARSLCRHERSDARARARDIEGHRALLVDSARA